MNDFKSAYRWGVSIAVAALLAWLVADCAQGQSVSVRGEGGIVAWATSSHGYQHAMRGRADLTATWELAENLYVVARAKLSLKRWGASDALIEHALLSAETARVYSRRQGASVGIRWQILEVGAEYDRRSVHHVWRHKGREPRHNYFPGSWRIGRSGHAPSYETDPIYPSLGYWELLRGYVRARSGPAEITVRLPGWRWKTLTLPWPALRVRATHSWQSWRVTLDVQGLGHRQPSGTLRLSRRLRGALWAHADAGWAHPPQWRDVKLRRVAFGLVLKTR
jgi:hypothetical protein